MLKLSLTPGEYITIGEDVVVQLYHMEGGRSYLAVKAPREIPILRGTVADNRTNLGFSRLTSRMR